MPISIQSQGASPTKQQSQHGAYIRDTRASIGRRHLLYDLERHQLEASPLTQLFITLAKRRSSWWTAPPQPQEPSVNHSQRPVSALGTSAAGGELHTSKRDTTMNTTAATAKPTAEHDLADEAARMLLIPDTIVWENNIPKGWYYFDRKEGHVLRRKVETKAIQQAFLRDAQYADDVVAVLYCTDTSSERGEPAILYQFITAASLEGFLFENGRGKGTAILQQFTQSLHAAHNDCIEAVWSPSLFHVNRRQNIHEIADDRVDINDRCITFEGKTHFSKLVQCTSRLRDQVRTACEAFVRHFNDTDTKHVVSRLVLRFKMNGSSELVLLHCVSVRIMRAAMPQPIFTKAGGVTPALGDPSKAAADGGGSVFYKQYRVCLDLAMHYDRRPPAAVSTESRSVLARLSEKTEARLRSGSLELSKSKTPTPRVQAEKLTKPPEPTVGGQKASRHGFLVRPTRAESLSSDLTSVERHRRPTSALERGNIDTAIETLVTSNDFASFDAANPAQQRRVCRLLDKCVRKGGVSAVRRAVLQAQEADLTDAERMELLALQMQRLAAETAHLTIGNESGASVLSNHADENRRESQLVRPSAEASERAPTWNDVSDALRDTIYEVLPHTDAVLQGTMALGLGSCPSCRDGASVMARFVGALDGDAAWSGVEEPAALLSRTLQDAKGHFASPAELVAAVVLATLLQSPACAEVRAAGVSASVGGPPYYPVTVTLPGAVGRNSEARVKQRLLFACAATLDGLRCCPLVFVPYVVIRPPSVVVRRRPSARRDTVFTLGSDNASRGGDSGEFNLSDAGTPRREPDAIMTAEPTHNFAETTGADTSEGATVEQTAEEAPAAVGQREEEAPAHPPAEDLAEMRAPVHGDTPGTHAAVNEPETQDHSPASPVDILAGTMMQDGPAREATYGEDDDWEDDADGEDE
jgi:hypothetical protein